MVARPYESLKYDTREKKIFWGENVHHWQACVLGFPHAGLAFHAFLVEAYTSILFHNMSLEKTFETYKESRRHTCIHPWNNIHDFMKYNRVTQVHTEIHSNKYMIIQSQQSYVFTRDITHTFTYVLICPHYSTDYIHIYVHTHTQLYTHTHKHIHTAILSYTLTFHCTFNGKNHTSERICVIVPILIAMNVSDWIVEVHA